MIRVFCTPIILGLLNFFGNIPADGQIITLKNGHMSGAFAGFFIGGPAWQPE